MSDDFDQESIGADLTINTQASQTAVEQLKDQINRLNAANEFLAEGFRKGTIEEDKFTVASKMVQSELRAKETLLRSVAGTGGEGGFEGVASSAFKAERVMNAMVSGGGLWRMGPMLDGLLSKLGGPAGMGFALVGLEAAYRTLWPTLEKAADKLGIFQGTLDTEKIKDAANQTKHLADEADRLANKPTKLESETNRLADEYLVGATGKKVQQGIQAAYETRAQKQAEQAVQDSIATFGVVQEEAEDMMARWAKDIKAAADKEFTNLVKSSTARAEAITLARETPGEFPADFVKQIQDIHKRAIDKLAKDDQNKLDRERRKAEELEKAAARANDPSNQLRAMQQAEQDALDRQIGQAWNAGGRQETPEQLQMIAQHATANRRLGADIATAVNMAVYQTQEQIMQSFYQMMNPGGNSRQIGGSPY